MEHALDHDSVSLEPNALEVQIAEYASDHPLVVPGRETLEHLTGIPSLDRQILPDTVNDGSRHVCVLEQGCVGAYVATTQAAGRAANASNANAMLASSRNDDPRFVDDVFTRREFQAPAPVAGEIIDRSLDRWSVV